jgi:hypothetical protein
VIGEGKESVISLLPGKGIKLSLLEEREKKHHRGGVEE